jgi:hypothetical protein
VFPAPPTSRRSPLRNEPTASGSAAGSPAAIPATRAAFALFAPGGRLVAVCASGPHEREELGKVCSEWIDLPAGSFEEQGTVVNAVIVVLDN